MKRRQFRILDSAPLVALTGVLAASFTVSDPGSTVAVPCLALGGIVLTAAIAKAQKGSDRVTFLWNLMLFGVGVRLYTFALIHATVGPYVFAPDAFTYERWGNGVLAYYTTGGSFPAQLQDTLQVLYPAMNAVLFWIFGQAKAAPAIANIFFGVWTAIPMYHLALLVVRGNETVARVSAFLVVMFPSMILWSVLNVREAPTILVIMTTVFFMARVQRDAGPREILGVVAGLAILTMFRQYLTSLVGIAGLVGILMGRSRAPAKALAAGSVLLIVLTLGGQSFGMGGTLTNEPVEVLEGVGRIRSGAVFDAGSAYGADADVTTVGGAIRFLPNGLAHFLFAPFPWDIRTVLQAITLPEILLWYALVPFALHGMRLGFRHDLRAYTVPLAVVIVVTFAYALAEGNVGTAYRHRAQVLPLIFLYCAVGITDSYAVWVRRRAAKSRVRRGATAAVSPRYAGGGSSVSRPT